MCTAAAYFDSDCKIAFHEQWLIYSPHLHSWWCLFPQACLLNAQSSSPLLKDNIIHEIEHRPGWCSPSSFLSFPVTCLFRSLVHFCFYWFGCLLLRAVRTPYILRKTCLCALCCNFYLVSLFIFWICSWDLFFCHAETFYVIKFIYAVISFMALWIWGSIGQGIRHSKN